MMVTIKLYNLMGNVQINLEKFINTITYSPTGNEQS